MWYLIWDNSVSTEQPCKMKGSDWPYGAQNSTAHVHTQHERYNFQWNATSKKLSLFKCNYMWNIRASQMFPLKSVFSVVILFATRMGLASFKKCVSVLCGYETAGLELNKAVWSQCEVSWWVISDISWSAPALHLAPRAHQIQWE